MRTGRLPSSLIVLAGIPLLLLSIAVAVTLGPAPLSVTDVAGVVGARLGLGDTDVSRIGQGIVWQLRLPRAVLAAICGAGLGVCGAVLQSLLRNPLADPFLLGVSAGASTGAVLVVILGLGAGAIGLTAGAFAGALVAFALVMTLGAVAGGTTTHLVLAGVAGTQLFSALTSFVVITSADAEQTRGVLFWLLGSLSGARWNDVAVSGAVCAVCLLLCLSRAGALDAFALGHDTAAALGVHVTRLRVVLLVATALLTATLVAAAGAIGFVGLVLPQAARLLVGPRHRALLPVTAVLGAILLVWVDVLATTVAAPQEVPVGVMTALVGVPAFAALLARRGRTS
ncbi:FecCD family ABC transporter permease [Saccharopolyspora karakumensis]|uniref:FecCD family ABC transporter permease n=1 Tax=Saccharopolyspora karakumensis TaxID=2530386 RepID=UPI001F1D959D|nr:iron chelate uptake ABC transporter family permease subunit [Saccharopolyspora karakumensis]